MTTDAAPTEQQITFQGRDIGVRLPSAEQLLVWQRTARQLENADTSDWNGTQVLVAMNRALNIVYSLLTDKADKDWIDDLMLEGELQFPGLTQIIQLTVEKFGEDGNRAERRAQKPAKKVTRRKLS